MIWRCFIRASLLAYALFFGGAGSVLAHALPGSALLIRQDESELKLTIQFPLEDAIIAEPELAVLEGMKADEPLSHRMEDRLVSYLHHHLSLTAGGASLPLTLYDARIQTAYHDHVGHFLQIVTQWRAASIEIEPNSLVLKYDAVMHEVRNHRATVRFLMQNRDARQIAEFGFLDAEKGIPLDLRATGLE